MGDQHTISITLAVLETPTLNGRDSAQIIVHYTNFAFGTSSDTNAH